MVSTTGLDTKDHTSPHKLVTPTYLSQPLLEEVDDQFQVIRRQVLNQTFLTQFPHLVFLRTSLTPFGIGSLESFRMTRGVEGRGGRRRGLGGRVKVEGEKAREGREGGTG